LNIIIFFISDILHTRAVYQKCQNIIIIIFNPHKFQKKLSSRKVFGGIKEGVKYYMSAFYDIFHTCKTFLEKVFEKLGGGEVEYYNSAFLMYCVYTFPLIFQKTFYEGRVFGKLGGN